MTEYLDEVQFKAATVKEADEAAQFHARYGHKLQLRARAELVVHTGTQSVIRPDVSSTARGLTMALPMSGLPEDVAPHLADLEGPLGLAEWLGRAKEKEPYVTVSIDLTYKKQHAPERDEFVAYTEEALDDIRDHIRIRRVKRTLVGPITIRTPLTMAPIKGDGVTIVPMEDASKCPGASRFLCPKDAPAFAHPFLAGLQADHLGLELLGRDLGEAASFNLRHITNFAEWLQSEDLLPKLASEYLKARPPPQDDEGLKTLERELRVFKADLLGDAVRKFELAKAGFREVSVELLRDLHKMRGEVMSLIGSDFFHTSVSIAVVVAGLKLSDIFEIGWALALGMLVGGLFFIGGLVKARTQEAEFRQLIAFNKHFAELPLAQAMPQYHDWYVKTINQSIRMFYGTLALGYALIGVPLYGVFAVWAEQAWTAAPPPAWTFLGLSGLSAMIAGIIWVRGSWRELLILPQG